MEIQCLNIFFTSSKPKARVKYVFLPCNWSMVRVSLVGDLVKRTSLGLFEMGTSITTDIGPHLLSLGVGEGERQGIRIWNSVQVNKEAWSGVDNTFEEGQRLSVTGRIVLRLQENSLQSGGEKKDEVSKHLLRRDVHSGTQKPLPLMLSSHQACPLSEFQFREQYFLSPLPISFFQTKLTQTLNLLASMLWASLSLCRPPALEQVLPDCQCWACVAS